MSGLRWHGLAVLATLSVLAAKPVINERNGIGAQATVANAAALARGSVFVVRGAGLGPDDGVAGEAPYGPELGGATISLRAGDGGVYAAALISAAAGQVVAIVPAEAPAGVYALAAGYGGETSNAARVVVVEANFGLLTNTGASGGMAQGAVGLTYASAAVAGDEVEFSGSGLGVGAGDGVEGAVMLIGGVEAPVTWLGADPSRPGYDTVRVTLPAEGVPVGCAVLFRLRVGELTTETFSLPVVGERGAVCDSGLGISDDGLRRLSDGGDVVIGEMTLTRVVAAVRSSGLSYEARVDQFGGGFTRYGAPAMAARMARAAMLREGGCVVYTPLQSGGEALDAGDSLTLAGPAWAVQAGRSEGNTYGVELARAFTGIEVSDAPGTMSSPIAEGQYRLDGPGGAVVGPFTVETSAGEPFEWTNGSGVDAVSRDQDLEFTWTGGAAGGWVRASGTARGLAPDDPATVVERGFECVAPAGAGRIVVPAGVLKQMPIVTAAAGGAGSTFHGSLALSLTGPPDVGVFQAPLVEGGSTEPGAFSFTSIQSRAPVLFPLGGGGGRAPLAGFK